MSYLYLVLALIGVRVLDIPNVYIILVILFIIVVDFFYHEEIDGLLQDDFDGMGI